MENEIKDNVNVFLKFYNSTGGSAVYLEKRKFYSSNKSKDYMNYIMTGIKDMKKMDYMSYMENKQKCFGVFNQDGIMSAEKRKEIREQMKTTKSVVWDMIISFREEFGITWCDKYEQAYPLLKKELPKFFKRVGLNPDNMEWFAGLHENTDNRHIHISFFEKEPQRFRRGKKEKAFSIGKLPKPAVLNFRPALELAMTDFKAREILTRKLINDRINEQINKNSGLIMKNKFLSLADKFPVKGSLSYDGTNMKFLKPEIDKFTNYLLSKNPEAENLKEDFINLAKDKDEMFERYCKRNKCNQPFYFQKKYMDDFYRRIGNKIINFALDIKLSDVQRKRLNAQVRKEKIRQKNKLWNEIEECMYLSNKVDYEIMKAFKDHMDEIEKARFARLVEEGEIDFEM